MSHAIARSLRTFTFALAIVTAACHGPSAVKARPAPVGLPANTAVEERVVDALRLPAYLRTRESGDWEPGVPVPGHPGEVRLSDGEIVAPPGDRITQVSVAVLATGSCKRAAALHHKAAALHHPCKQ
jgi:hypothetical protein